MQDIAMPNGPAGYVLTKTGDERNEFGWMPPAEGGEGGSVTAADITDATANGRSLIKAANYAAMKTLLAISDADVAPVTPNTQTGTTYTFVLADVSRLVTANNAADQVYTIPLNVTVAFPLGTTLQLLWLGDGQPSFAIAGGGTLHDPRGNKVGIKYGVAFAIKLATDTWVIGGDVTA